jgi:hypothetical protein
MVATFMVVIATVVLAMLMVVLGMLVSAVLVVSLGVSTVAGVAVPKGGAMIGTPPHRQIGAGRISTEPKRPVLDNRR